LLSPRPLGLLLLWLLLLLSMMSILHVAHHQALWLTAEASWTACCESLRQQQVAAPGVA
jgi:hypothetical protein